MTVREGDHKGDNERSHGDITRSTVPVGMLWLCADRVGDRDKAGGHQLVAVETILQAVRRRWSCSHEGDRRVAGERTLRNWAALTWGQTALQKQVALLSLSIQAGGQLGSRA